MEEMNFRKCEGCGLMMSNQPWSVSISFEDAEQIKGSGTYSLKEPPKYYCEKCAPKK